MNRLGTQDHNRIPYGMGAFCSHSMRNFPIMALTRDDR
jgi:hypothetical protein